MIKQLLSEHKIKENEVFNLLTALAETGSEYSD